MEDRMYFVCSIGQPGEEYDDENLQRCMTNKSYILHEGCKQKGAISKIKADDILVLKFKSLLIGYGRATSSVKEDSNIGSGWIFRVDVNSWIMGTHVSNYGIKWANVEGSPYAAVKEVERSFALEKMEEIGFPF